MTVDYANIELAAKRGNPSVIWRSGQELLFEITMNTEHYVDEEQDGKKKKVWSFR